MAVYATLQSALQLVEDTKDVWGPFWQKKHCIWTEVESCMTYVTGLFLDHLLAFLFVLYRTHTQNSVSKLALWRHHSHHKWTKIPQLSLWIHCHWRDSGRCFQNHLTVMSWLWTCLLLLPLLSPEGVLQTLGFLSLLVSILKSVLRASDWLLISCNHALAA